MDEEREQAAFARVMRPWLARTAVTSPMVTELTGLSSGYFATLVHLPPGPPIALTTDGVGTKILLARMAGPVPGRRRGRHVSYRLDALPEPAPVFGLIGEAGQAPPATLYATLHMGIGFCLVVGPDERDAALAALAGAGETPVVIGSVFDQPGRVVSIPALGLTGRGDTFTAA